MLHNITSRGMAICKGSNLKIIISIISAKGSSRFSICAERVKSPTFTFKEVYADVSERPPQPKSWVMRDFFWENCVTLQLRLKKSRSFTQGRVKRF